MEQDEQGKQKTEGFQLREIMQGISSIQTTLANFMLRLDGQGKHLDDITKEIRAKNGIQERLENVQEQANDTIYLVTELQDNQKKMERELNRLRDYVVKLEYRVNTQNNQIIDLKSRSMENNIIISGLEEKSPERKSPENLANILRNVFMSEMGMEEATVNELRINKLFRMGEYDVQRKFPRPICVQFSDKTQKDLVMKHIKVLKEKESVIRVAQQQPEEIRERRKQLYEVQKKYAERSIESKIKGDKLVFTQSNSVYREKVGPLPTADEVITDDVVNTAVSTGKSIEDNGNRFIAHATQVDSYKQIKKSLVDIMRVETVPSASHNIYAYRFSSSDGVVHEGSNDDGEHGAGRLLLKTLADNEINNALVVVSRWHGNNIGPRRFSHIKEAGLGAAKKLPVSV
ncbi:protein IMPACT homolog [Saccostrea cucullata]|uniref:protein IMPACT homolog n=1 Tax=Saccostrea cuccullata TaxID=36930 RepID=UPI002ED1495C